MALSKSRQIKDGLITVLTAMQLNGETAFVAVKGHPRGEFDGYPSARVLPGDQTNQVVSVGQHERAVNLIVRTHVKSKDDGSEFDLMYDLTDALLDALNDADFSNSLNALAPTVNTYLLNATRGDWYDTDSAAGVILVCDVNVEIKYSQL